MYGCYNYNQINQDFICYNHDIYIDEDIEIYFKGNLFLNKEEEERVLLKIIREYPNINILKDLKGEFVIALLNKEERYLSLIRDQFGVMPLYYSINADGVIFGTTIESIIKKAKNNISINQNVIHEYFMFRYVSGEDTIFNNIHEVKPGLILKINKSGKVTKTDYYQFKYSNTTNEKKISASSLFEKAFWESLTEQTFDKDRKEIGVLSSGGIDSSILVSCSSKILRPHFNTYYIGNEGYEHNRFDEVDYLANIYNTNHKNILISNKEFSDHLIETIKINEEPLNHPSSVLRYYLNTQIKNDVDVLLSGEGADCLYCGYYIFDLIRYFYVNNPVRPLSHFLANLFPFFLVPAGYKSRMQKLRKAFLLPPDAYTMLYSDFISLDPKNVGQIIDFGFPYDFVANYYSMISEYTKKDILNIILSIYQGHYLIEGLNTITKIGNACGLEFRHPFIDLDLVNLFNQFPWTDKIKFFKRKHQIVELGKKHLPEEFFNKRKEGFGVPLKNWFYEKNGLARFMELLVDKKTRERGVFNTIYLDKLIRFYKNSRMPDASFENILWPIINLELWFRIFVDRDISSYS